MPRLLTALALLIVSTLLPTARADRPVLVLDEIEVPAKPPKPEITIFVTRQDMRAELDAPLQETFIPKITETVDALPK